MKVLAKFKGSNGSLGYKTGQLYDLILSQNTIILHNGEGKCIYESLEAFFKNWDILYTK